MYLLIYCKAFWLRRSSTMPSFCNLPELQACGRGTRKKVFGVCISLFVIFSSKCNENKS